MQAPRWARWRSASSSPPAVSGRHLEDDAIGARRQRGDLDQQVARKRQPGRVTARERLQADFGQGVDDRPSPSTSSSKPSSRIAPSSTGWRATRTS
jgi:hypothetical protein